MNGSQSNSPAPLSTDERVNHPPHYKAHPSGVECIEIAEHYGFCIGNAIEDLKKARWYLDREISNREK